MKLAHSWKLYETIFVVNFEKEKKVCLTRENFRCYWYINCVMSKAFCGACKLTNYRVFYVPKNREFIVGYLIYTPIYIHIIYTDVPI